MRAGGLGVIILALGCLPGAPPDWLLQPEPEVLGMRMEVVADGPHSADLLPIPADRTRSEALPGDTVRLSALVANEDGVIDLDSLQPHWVLSHGASILGTADSPPCDATVPLETRESCLLGSTAVVEFVMPPLDPADTLEQRYSLGLVAGWRRSTSACLDLIAHNEVGFKEGTFDCLLARRSLNLGPVTRLIEIAMSEGIPLGEDDVEIEIPPEAHLVPPDFAPEIDSILAESDDVTIRAWPGIPLTIPVDVELSLLAPADPRDQQSYLARSGDARSETAQRTWHATADVMTRDRLLSMPADAEGVVFFYIATDSRGSQSWSVFEFRPESR